MKNWEKSPFSQMSYKYIYHVYVISIINTTTQQYLGKQKLDTYTFIWRVVTTPYPVT